MSVALVQVLELVQGLLASGFVVFLRVGAAVALLPAFGEQSVPMRVRLMLAIALTIIVAPAVLPQIAPADGVISFYLLTETVAGLAMGAALRLFVLALQIAGSIAAQSTSLSQIFGGGAVEPQPAFGHLLVIAGLALALMAGLHVRVVEVLILSYELMPAGQLPDADVLTEWGVAQVARAFATGFTLAMPFVIASLVYNVALGVINRAMPQLMVALVGAPAITGGGLILLALAAPLMLQVWWSLLDGFLLNPAAVR